MGDINVLGKITAKTLEGIVASANQIYDETQEKKQSEINAELYSRESSGESSSLNTDSKNIVGAINEINSKVNQIECESGTQSVGDNESIVGSYKETGESGIVSHSLYKKIVELKEMPSGGRTKEYTISNEKIGGNKLLLVESLSILDKTLGVFKYVGWKVDDINPQENATTTTIVSDNDLSSGDYVGKMELKYIKDEDTLATIRIHSTSDSGTASIAPLKFNKDAIVSYTMDDATATSLCVINAAIHKKPISASGYYYHSSQLDAGDVPNDIINSTLSDCLGFTDSCGNIRRFPIGAAIWANAKNGSNVVMMDSVSSPNPDAGNLYRFMCPYLQWDDIKYMLRFGHSIYQHNIDETTFDKTNSESVKLGFSADLQKVIDKVGRGINVLCRPDGNEVYTNAALTTDNILLIANEGSDNIIFPKSSLYKNKIARLFPADTLNENGSIDGVYSLITDEMAKSIAERKWIHFSSHTADINWVNTLKWINDTYGKDGSDNIWFATLDEVYQYMYIKNNASLKEGTVSGDRTISINIPKGQFFYYPEISILIDDAEDITSIEASDNIYGFSYTLLDNGKMLVNINTNPNLVTNAEYFTAKYEESGNNNDKNDALYCISLLKESLRQSYLTRLDVEVVDTLSLSSISINGGDATTETNPINVSMVISGTPTHYRIAESNIESAEWIAYTSSTVQFTMNGYGNKTIYCQVKNGSNVSSIKSSSITYNEVQVASTFTAEICSYVYLDVNTTALLDSNANKYVNYANVLYDDAVCTTADKLVDTSGNEIEVTRMPKADLLEYAGIETYTNPTHATSYDSAVLSELYACNPQFLYTYQWGNALPLLMGWNVENGTYRISALISTANTSANLGYYGIKINNVAKTLSDTTINLQTNTEFIELGDATIQDGKLVLQMQSTENSKTLGFNIIKIQKIA